MKDVNVLEQLARILYACFQTRQNFIELGLENEIGDNLKLFREKGAPSSIIQKERLKATTFKPRTLDVLPWQQISEEEKSKWLQVAELIAMVQDPVSLSQIAWDRYSVDDEFVRCSV